MRKWIHGILLFLVGLAYGVCHLDFWIQDLIFQTRLGFWAQEPAFWHALCYRGPKAVMWLGASWLLFLSIWPAYRRRVCWSLAYLLLLLGLVTLIKEGTQVSCPWSYARYGGSLQPESWFFHGPDHACFPGGHAMVGFSSWVVLFWSSSQSRFRVLALGWFLGLILGSYQVLRGAHFFSHAFVSGWLAYLCLIWLERCFRGERGDSPD